MYQAGKILSLQIAFFINDSRLIERRIHYMKWSTKNKIPLNNENFIKIINGFVFYYPSSVRSSSKTSKHSYKAVSARNCSFIYRKICDSKLRTILSKIKAPLILTNSYKSIGAKDSVEKTVSGIISTTHCSDPNFEIIVYQKRSDMPDIEAIYYYIRNAFAHGSFEVIQENGRNIYILESKKDNTIKAQMRLYERSMLELISYANMSPNEITALQKHRKKRV